MQARQVSQVLEDFQANKARQDRWGLGDRKAKEVPQEIRAIPVHWVQQVFEASKAKEVHLECKALQDRKGIAETRGNLEALVTWDFQVLQDHPAIQVRKVSED